MRTIIFTFLLSLLSIGAFAQQSAFSSKGLNIASSDAPAAASWDVTEHNFGAIPQNQPVTHTFMVTNSGQQPLVIEHVKPSCGCTIADFTQEAINPGETGYVKATYNAQSVGMFVKTVTVTTNDEEVHHVLRIKGEVVE